MSIRFKFIWRPIHFNIYIYKYMYIKKAYTEWTVLAVSFMVALTRNWHLASFMITLTRNWHLSSTSGCAIITYIYIYIYIYTGWPKKKNRIRIILVYFCRSNKKVYGFCFFVTLYIDIYMCVCVCACVKSNVDRWLKSNY